MSTPPIIPPVSHSSEGPDGAPEPFIEVTHGVKHQPVRAAKDVEEKVKEHAPKRGASAVHILMLGTFVGFTLGVINRLIVGRP